MSFINPFFLYFLPLASIPVILHILNKSRYKKVEFSSLQFLSELKNDVIKKLKLKQLLLLIIRTLIIIFIILIFARPVITTRQSVAKIKRGESVYLLIDNSFSLRKSAKGVALFANQLDRIMAQLEDAAYPINVKIITSTRPEEFEFAGLVDNFDQFREILLTLETNANQGRNLAALATIKSDITREQLVSPIIWIMSDFQRETDNYLQEFPQKLAELPTERILLFPAKYQQENYAIVESLFPDQILELNNDLTISAIVDHEGEEGHIVDRFCMHIEDLDADSAERQSLLDSPPDWLKKKDAPGRYLRGSTLIRILERFRFEAENPGAAVHVQVPAEETAEAD